MNATGHPGTVPVRHASVQDLAAILAILAESPSAPQWSEAEFRDILHQADTATDHPLLRCVWMAYDQAFAVATVLRTVYPAEAELESIAVAPAARKQGMGAALIEAIAAWAVTMGAGVLRLEVRASNHTALRLYTRCGFRHCGLRQGYYSHPAEDAVCMERTIGHNSNAEHRAAGSRVA